MRIYLAGPLFCESEKMYNILIRDRLEENGISVHLPQDGDLQIDPARMGDGEYSLKTAEKVFLTDLRAIDSCDAVVFNLDGRVPDEGACVEIGYAYARGKPVYGLKTDVRCAEYGIDNMMITGAIGRRMTHSIEELIALLVSEN